MRRFFLPAVALMTAGVALAQAPIIYHRNPPTRAEPPPAEQQRIDPQPPRAERATRPPPPPVSPPPPPAAKSPDWAAGPGTPLSAFALQPEEAAPFNPAAAPRTHVVAAGDTLFALSVRYQTPLRPLIEANHLDAPFALAVGQTLKLPPPRTHRVRRGETLTGLARQYDIDARSLALLNRLAKPYAVRVGDTLVLPALSQGDDSTPATPEPRPATGPTRFAWPLIGPILTRFGPQSGGRRSDGVDIAATDGAEVKAAADGRVVYAGDDLAGYGNLMLVQHADGWVTAYAHCSSFAVKEGDRVRQGQKLGQVGKTAGGEAKLHFQVRRAGAPTDPLAALPPI